MEQLTEEIRALRRDKTNVEEAIKKLNKELDSMTVGAESEKERISYLSESAKEAKKQANIALSEKKIVDLEVKSLVKKRQSLIEDCTAIKRDVAKVDADIEVKKNELEKKLTQEKGMLIRIKEEEKGLKIATEDNRVAKDELIAEQGVIESKLRLLADETDKSAKKIALLTAEYEQKKFDFEEDKKKKKASLDERERKLKELEDINVGLHIKFTEENNRLVEATASAEKAYLASLKEKEAFFKRREALDTEEKKLNILELRVKKIAHEAGLNKEYDDLKKELDA